MAGARGEDRRRPLAGDPHMDSASPCVLLVPSGRHLDRQCADRAPWHRSRSDRIPAAVHKSQQGVARRDRHVGAQLPGPRVDYRWRRLPPMHAQGPRFLRTDEMRECLRQGARRFLSLLVAPDAGLVFQDGQPLYLRHPFRDIALAAEPAFCRGSAASKTSRSLSLPSSMSPAARSPRPGMCR
jgi:hypothetical protein